DGLNRHALDYSRNRFARRRNLRHHLGGGGAVDVAGTFEKHAASKTCRAIVLLICGGILRGNAEAGASYSNLQVGERFGGKYPSWVKSANVTGSAPYARHMRL